ncbi:MAG TPA: Rid family detoxifying hydrolase [Pseudomonadales bacterium]
MIERSNNGSMRIGGRALAVLAVAAPALLTSQLGRAGVATEVEFLNSGAVLPKSLPFSEAVRHGDTLYLSGQIGVKPGTLELVEGGLAAQARQTLENIRTTLEAHGYSMRDVIKCTVMLADMSEWAAFNEIYQSFFEPPYPARSAFGASGLAMGARLELECIAARGEN